MSQELEILDLERVDGRPLVGREGGVDAYMVVRNEASRLPHVLDHHRRLGVERFFVVDNASTDDTLGLLLAQPDCIVHRTESSFAAAGCGMAWINALMVRHGQGRWCLFIDADELFVYPHADVIALPDFCGHLDHVGAEGVFAIMVDMYGPGPLRDAHYRAGTSFVETCPLYDPEYRLRPRPGLPFRRRFQPVEAVGGPRLRLFYPDLATGGIAAMALARARRAFGQSRLGRWLGLHRTGFGACPPDITKIPLMKGATGRFWASNHRTTPLRLTDIRATLLHFKFFSDFDAKSRIEAERGQHWGGGSEYARYQALLARQPDMVFAHADSHRYEGPESLVRDGIMLSTPDLDALAAQVRAATARTGNERALSGRRGW